MGDRKTKSYKIIDELDANCTGTVAVQNPFSEIMESAKKHIEFLEMCLTGITGRERNTIVKLEKELRAEKKKVAYRDSKLKEVRDRLKVIKGEYLKEAQRMEEKWQEELDCLKGEMLEKTVHDYEELRKKIELEFIERLKPTEVMEDTENSLDCYQRSYHHLMALRQKEIEERRQEERWIQHGNQWFKLEPRWK